MTENTDEPSLMKVEERLRARAISGRNSSDLIAKAEISRLDRQVSVRNAQTGTPTPDQIKVREDIDDMRKPGADFEFPDPRTNPLKKK